MPREYGLTVYFFKPRSFWASLKPGSRSGHAAVMVHGVDLNNPLSAAASEADGGLPRVDRYASLYISLHPSKYSAAGAIALSDLFDRIRGRSDVRSRPVVASSFTKFFGLMKPSFADPSEGNSTNGFRYSKLVKYYVPLSRAQVQAALTRFVGLAYSNQVARLNPRPRRCPAVYDVEGGQFSQSPVFRPEPGALRNNKLRYTFMRFSTQTHNCVSLVNEILSAADVCVSPNLFQRLVWVALVETFAASLAVGVAYTIDMFVTLSGYGDFRVFEDSRALVAIATFLGWGILSLVVLSSWRVWQNMPDSVPEDGVVARRTTFVSVVRDYGGPVALFVISFAFLVFSVGYRQSVLGDAADIEVSSPFWDATFDIMKVALGMVAGPLLIPLPFLLMDLVFAFILVAASSLVGILIFILHSLENVFLTGAGEGLVGGLLVVLASWVNSALCSGTFHLITALVLVIFSPLRLILTDLFLVAIRMVLQGLADQDRVVYLGVLATFGAAVVGCLCYGSVDNVFGILRPGGLDRMLRLRQRTLLRFTLEGDRTGVAHFSPVMSEQILPQPGAGGVLPGAAGGGAVAVAGAGAAAGGAGAAAGGAGAPPPGGAGGGAETDLGGSLVSL